jgi:phosphoglycerate dehydrogenase-like enzyme
MKNTAILINVARGEVMDKHVFAEAIKNEEIIFNNISNAISTKMPPYVVS